MNSQLAPLGKGNIDALHTGVPRKAARLKRMQEIKDMDDYTLWRALDATAVRNRDGHPHDCTQMPIQD